MQRVLIYRANPDSITQLRPDMEEKGWAVDESDGMLEMLRLIEEYRYEIVVLNASRLKVETCILLGTIGQLPYAPKVVLSLPEPIDALPTSVLRVGHSVVRGSLTSEKILDAIANDS